MYTFTTSQGIVKLFGTDILLMIISHNPGKNKMPEVHSEYKCYIIGATKDILKYIYVYLTVLFWDTMKSYEYLN